MRAWWLLVAFLPALASAQMPPAPSICSPSPRIPTNDYPGPRNIPPSNDLTRYNGKSVSADGQRLLVQLRVRDTRCVPIQDATVEMWQLNPYGNYRIISMQDRVTPNAVFSGAGRSYTDNNGGVQFITLFPAATKTHAPRIHIRVKAPGLPVYDTILYFQNDVRNATDPWYKRLSETNRSRVELKMSPSVTEVNSFVGATEIILPGKAKYRSY